MITTTETVTRYATQHSQMASMLADIETFVGNMPAPDEDGDIPGVDYAYLGDVSRIHAALRLAADLVYEMSGD